MVSQLLTINNADEKAQIRMLNHSYDDPLYTVRFIFQKIGYLTVEHLAYLINMIEVDPDRKLMVHFVYCRGSYTGLAGKLSLRYSSFA